MKSQDTDRSSQITPLKNDIHKTSSLEQDCNRARAGVLRPHDP